MKLCVYCSKEIIEEKLMIVIDGHAHIPCWIENEKKNPNYEEDHKEAEENASYYPRVEEVQDFYDGNYTYQNINGVTLES